MGMLRDTMNEYNHLCFVVCSQSFLRQFVNFAVNSISSSVAYLKASQYEHLDPTETYALLPSAGHSQNK